MINLTTTPINTSYTGMLFNLYANYYFLFNFSTKPPPGAK